MVFGYWSKIPRAVQDPQHQPNRVQEAFGKCSGTSYDLSCPVQDQELDTRILTGSFQLMMKCSMILCKKETKQKIMGTHTHKKEVPVKEIIERCSYCLGITGILKHVKLQMAHIKATDS